MLEAAGAGVIVAMAVALIRALKGPSVYDRLLAANACGTKTVLFIAIIGFVAGRPDFLDIALLYTLINFISTVAVLKFMHYRDLGRGLVSAEPSHD